MSSIPWQNWDKWVEDENLRSLFSLLTTEMLVGLLKHRLNNGEAEIGEVVKELVGDDECSVLIMKKK